MIDATDGLHIWAHRGWHGADAPENSVAAFARAGDAGVGIETDLRTTRDGELILFHDRTVGGIPVDRLDRAEVEAAAGRPVPTLADLLDMKLGVPLNLEVKTRAAWAALAPWLARGLPEDTLVSSFVHAIPVAAAARGVETALLLASAPAPFALTPSPCLETIVWDYNIVDAELLAASAGAGFANIVYGAKSADEHAALAGCAGVITDHPDIALSLRAAAPISRA